MQNSKVTSNNKFWKSRLERENAFYREGCQKRTKKRGVIRHTFLSLYVMLSCRNSRFFLGHPLGRSGDHSESFRAFGKLSKTYATSMTAQKSLKSLVWSRFSQTFIYSFLFLSHFVPILLTEQFPSSEDLKISSFQSIRGVTQEKVSKSLVKVKW